MIPIPNARPFGERRRGGHLYQTYRANPPAKAGSNSKIPKLVVTFIHRLKHFHMSFVKVYVHCVWTTKNRYPFLNDHNIRNAMWSHIIEHGRQKGIYVDFINGYTEHCHCLIALSSDQTLQKSLQLLKGESSYWANRAQLTKEKFEWQNEYYAVSISPVELNAVRDYINNQEEHHRKITFQEEYNNLINEWGFVRYVDGRLLV